MSQALLHTKVWPKMFQATLGPDGRPFREPAALLRSTLRNPGIQPIDYITKVLSRKGLKPAFPLILKKNNFCDYAVGEKFSHVIAGHGGPALRQWRTTTRFSRRLPAGQMWSSTMRRAQSPSTKTARGRTKRANAGQRPEWSAKSALTRGAGATRRPAAENR